MTIGEWTAFVLRFWERLEENYRKHLRGRNSGLGQVRADELATAQKILANSFFAEELIPGPLGLKYYEQEINKIAEQNKEHKNTNKPPELNFKHWTED